MTDDLVDVHELAQALGVTIRGTEERHRRGQPPPAVERGPLRWRRADIEGLDRRTEWG